MLNRMVELATQSANGTYEDATDRAQLQKEVTQLKEEIDRIADSANFNGIKLLDGSMSTDGKATLNGKATTSAAGVDLNIVMGAYTNAAGSDAYLEIKLAHSSTADSAVVSNDGATLTLTMNSKKDYSVDDITKLLKSATIATGGTLSQDVQDSILNAIKEATVSGTGITGVAAATKFAVGSAAVPIAKMNANGKELVLQIGDTSDDFNQLSVSINDMHVAALGLDVVNIGTQEGAQNAIDVIKKAINSVSDMRGTLGATQNRLDHTINNLSVMEENIQDAESTIRDTDVAEEMMAYTKNNILIQSAQAMLAQANQVPQGVLQLLQ